EIDRLVNRHRDLSACRSDIEDAFEILRTSFREGGLLLVCGNGGSSSDADHLVAELMKGFQRARQAPAALRNALQDDHGSQGELIGNQLQSALPAISLG